MYGIEKGVFYYVNWKKVRERGKGGQNGVFRKIRFIICFILQGNVCAQKPGNCVFLGVVRVSFFN